MWSELAFSFQTGNYYIYSIMGLTFLGLVIIFERLVKLLGQYNLNFDKFLGNLKKMVKAKDIDRAISLCKSASQTSLPRIALKALEASEVDPTSVRGTIEEETIAFLPKLESRLSLVPTLATLIMLIGILGTIASLWDSFHSVNVLDTAKKQASIAQGIATSLNSTAMGLLVCMILLAAHQGLKSVAISITERIHYGVAVLHNLLVPQDMVYASVTTSAPQSVEGQDTKETSSQQEATSDDTFDDASVEDIKDEEEII